MPESQSLWSLCSVDSVFILYSAFSWSVCVYVCVCVCVCVCVLCTEYGQNILVCGREKYAGTDINSPQREQCHALSFASWSLLLLCAYIHARTQTLATSCSALLFGCIYNRMGRSQSSIQDRMGLLQVSRR
jgi:hypothetical protein